MSIFERSTRQLEGRFAKRDDENDAFPEHATFDRCCRGTAANGVGKLLDDSTPRGENHEGVQAWVSAASRGHPRLT